MLQDSSWLSAGGQQVFFPQCTTGQMDSGGIFSPPLKHAILAPDGDGNPDGVYQWSEVVQTGIFPWKVSVLMKGAGLMALEDEHSLSIHTSEITWAVVAPPDDPASDSETSLWIYHFQHWERNLLYSRAFCPAPGVVDTLQKGPVKASQYG